jgi:hypothetical protein
LAALFAILTALRRAVQRDLGTFGSIKVNNFFLFVYLIIYANLNSGLAPSSAYALLLLLGFLLLFPLSSDPLARIPPDRLALWPLTRGQRVALRITSLLLSPIMWIAILIMVKTRVTLAVAFLLLAVGMQAVIVLSNTSLRWNPLRHVPQVPGRFGGMIRNNIRQLLSLLDPYLALILSIGGCAYRFFSRHPDAAAYPILSLLIALALSTYAQSLFGLDIGSGMTRYRLLPLRGWEVLLAKDLAFLTILVILVLPLSVGPGLTFGLVALAVGHHSSVFLRLPQHRWRFATGRLLPIGLVQGIGGFALGFTEHQRGLVVLLLTGVGFLMSLIFYGWCWDRHTRRI